MRVTVPHGHTLSKLSEFGTQCSGFTKPRCLPSQSTFISKDLLNTYYAAGTVWSIRDTSMEEKKKIVSIVQEFATYWRQADSKQSIYRMLLFV